MILATIISIAVILLGFAFWLIQKITTKLVMDEIFFQIRNRGYVQKLCYSLIKFAALQHPKEDRQLFFENTIPNIEELISGNRILAAIGNSFSIVWNTKWSLYLLWVLHSISGILSLGWVIFATLSNLSILTILLCVSSGIMLINYPIQFYKLFLKDVKIELIDDIREIMTTLGQQALSLFTAIVAFVVISKTLTWAFLALAITILLLWLSTLQHKRIYRSFAKIN